MRAPLPWKWASSVPPCCPASPFESSSPPVATPTTPTMGIAGKRMRSVILISPSRTSKIFVTGFSTKSMSWPKPGMSVATPHSTGRTSRISAMSESPGSAPRTATGPVALLIRERSISVTRSLSLRICPVKQSFVSNVTVSPGSTSSTGWRSGPNDQITWSRDRKCCLGIRWCHLFFDVDTLDVRESVGPVADHERGQRDAECEPGEGNPVRVLERVGRRVFVELVVERQEEEHDPADRQHDVQERVELRPPRPQVVPHAADAHEHVDEDDERHRSGRDDAEADAGVPLPADEQRQHDREDRHPDDRDVRRLELVVRAAELLRSEPVARERVEHARRRVHRRVRVRRDRVADREEHEDPAGAPENLAEVAPRVGAGGLGDERIEPCAEDPGVGAEHVEDPDRDRRADDGPGYGASW